MLRDIVIQFLLGPDIEYKTNELENQGVVHDVLNVAFPWRELADGSGDVDLTPQFSPRPSSPCPSSPVGFEEEAEQTMMHYGAPVSMISRV
jgi:hypothetical protein